MTQANGLAASDVDCSNAAFFSARPFAPQFSSSPALMRRVGRQFVWRDGDPDTARRNVILLRHIKPELAVARCCSIQQDDQISPQNLRSSVSETPAFPPTGVSLYSRLLFEMPRRSEDRPDRDRLALRFEQFKKSK